MGTVGTKREIWIDYMKAVACLSVLTFHVIYGLQNANMKCGIVLTTVKEICGIFQIPVFMFASGYLFGKHKMGNYFKFEGRKLLNLGVPYIVFTVLYYAINVTFSSSVNFTYELQDLIDIYKTPLAQYWYIFATILIFLFLPIFEQIIQNELVLFGFLLTWKLVNAYWLSVTNYDYYFSQYACYFYLGVLYARHHETFSLKKETPRSLVSVLILFIAVYVSRRYYDWGISYTVVEFFLEFISIYLLATFFECYAERMTNGFLNIVGKYSFQIYLMHTMVTAAVRIVLSRVGIVSQWPQFFLGWIFGLGVTVVVSWICEKTIWLNIVFFPERTVKQWKKKESNV